MPIDPDCLHFVLATGLPQEDLIELLRFMDITFPGVRPSQLGKGELADALSDEFSKNPSAALKIARALDSKLPRPFPDLSGLNSRPGFRSFRRSLREAGPPELAAYLWWLSKEEGPQARRAYEAALDALDQRFDKLEKAAATEVLADVFERSEKAVELEKSLEEARQSDRQKERRIAELLHQFEEAQKRLRQKDAELSRNSEQIRQMETALKEKEGLRSSAEELERLRAETARTLAEAAGLRQELSRAREKLARYGSLQRIGLFVDANNLIAAARELYGRALDFQEIRKAAESGADSAGRLIVEAYAYLAEDPAQEKESLKARFRHAGFTVRARPIIFRSDGTAKGDWDLGIAVEVLERADRLDIIVLGTGDGDFLDLVQHLKERKPHLHVEIACFESPRHTSERLLQAADQVHFLGHRHLLDPQNAVRQEERTSSSA